MKELKKLEINTIAAGVCFCLDGLRILICNPLQVDNINKCRIVCCKGRNAHFYTDNILSKPQKCAIDEDIPDGIDELCVVQKY